MNEWFCKFHGPTEPIVRRICDERGLRYQDDPLYYVRYNAAHKTCVGLPAQVIYMRATILDCFRKYGARP